MLTVQGSTEHGPWWPVYHLANWLLCIWTVRAGPRSTLRFVQLSHNCLTSWPRLLRWILNIHSSDNNNFEFWIIFLFWKWYVVIPSPFRGAPSRWVPRQLPHHSEQLPTDHCTGHDLGAWEWCLVEMLDNAKNSAVNGGSKATTLRIMSNVIWIFFCESRASRSILNLRGGLSCFYVSYRSLENMTTWPFGIYSLSTAPLKLGQYPKKSIKAQPSWI